MHGMLSLGVLVAAFAGLAGWIGYMLVRLYRACPVGRSPTARPSAHDLADRPAGGGSADEHAAAPEPVA